MRCDEFDPDETAALPGAFAREDGYGGPPGNRMRLLVRVVDAVRGAVGPGYPVFPRFASPPEGGITAWYTMRLTDPGEDRTPSTDTDLDPALPANDARDAARAAVRNDRFRR